MTYDAIFLAPHLDDVALSCGGQVHALTRAGRRVLVVTIMAGEAPVGPLSDFAELLHSRWELGADTVARRRAEDATACQVLGAAWQHWDVPDCIYRRSADGEWLYPTWTAVITTRHPADDTLIASLANRFQALPHTGQIVAPLGVGSHVDHRIVRLAAEAAFGRQLWYYEDYPYVREEGSLEQVVLPGDSSWQASVVPLTAANLAARTEAIAAYASQVGSFFNGRADLDAQINAYAQQVGGERLWQRQ